MFVANNDLHGPKQRKRPSAEDSAGRTDDGRAVIRFSRRHRRRPSLWPLVAAAVLLGLLLTLWWLSDRLM